MDVFILFATPAKPLVFNFLTNVFLPNLPTSYLLLSISISRSLMKLQMKC